MTFTALLFLKPVIKILGIIRKMWLTFAGDYIEMECGHQCPCDSLVDPRTGRLAELISA